MPAPDLNALRADPERLLVWLQHNLLMAGPLENVLNPPGTAWATILPRQPIVPAGPLPEAVNTSGERMDVFDLRSNGAGINDGLLAYICNYTANQHHSLDLAQTAAFCFTINLNGCTFGISALANGGRRVTHSNRGGNTISQRADIQQAHGTGPNLAGVTLLEPANYRRLGAGGGLLHATVFGIRGVMGWKFYFQSYTSVTGTNFKVHGVFPI